MSDILIKGVSLEDFKPICPCMNGDYGCCNIPGVKRCYGIGKDGCPLAEIPPHGRLIDADAVAKMVLGSVNQEDAQGFMFTKIICQILKDAPTIIPAEEGEK